MKRVSLVQYRVLQEQENRAVAALIDNMPARRIAQIKTVYELADLTAKSGASLAQTIRGLTLLEAVDVQTAEREGRLLPPIDHADPAHLYVTGTGLTHLGSASSRDGMHRSAAKADGHTDSMQMFLMGVEGGKPGPGEIGVQPEWFYKGNGDSLLASGQPLVSPAFALDAGEEPEIAGIYLIAEDGSPLRLGYALANEFSDHVTERTNYLWLAHSKLRPAALGPELLISELPARVDGKVRIRRYSGILWEKPFHSGEANMSHSIENLEHHHFKYPLFRRPGDVHVHMFGTATLSFSDGVMPADGDVFEIEARPFRHSLRNALKKGAPETVRVSQL